MAAPKGNNYWMLAQNAGRPRIYQSPEELEKDLLEYIKFASTNTYKQQVLHPKFGATTIEHTRPLTKESCAAFLGLSYSTLWKDYKNRDEFSPLLTRMETIIHSTQLEGAMTGAYKENIVSRYQSLKEKSESDNKQDGEIKITIVE